MLKTIIKFLRGEVFFSSLFLLFLLLYSIVRPPISFLYTSIHWETIITLVILLLLTESIKESNFFNYILSKETKIYNNKFLLHSSLIIFSSFLAMFLTNDITLFIIIPFIYKLKEKKIIDYKESIILYILNTIAVNIGSFLTPIGNPQNIYIWHKYDINFFSFIKIMLYPFIISLAILILFAISLEKYLNIKNKSFKIKLENESINFDKNLFVTSFVLLIISITLIQLDYTFLLFPFIIIFYLFKYPHIIKKLDIIFILIFILFFINIALLTKINNIIYTIIHKYNTFLSTTIISQIISNVPATILISKYTQNYKEILFGVNIGGTFFIISSFANIITYRITKDKNYLFYYNVIGLIYSTIVSILIFYLLL